MKTIIFTETTNYITVSLLLANVFNLFTKCFFLLTGFTLERCFEMEQRKHLDLSAGMIADVYQVSHLCFHSVSGKLLLD